MAFSRKQIAITAVSALAVAAQTGCSTTEPQRAIAALHGDTTPFSAFKKKIEMSSGQTYLGFMRHQVKPALDSFEDDIQAEEKAKPKQYSAWQTDLIKQGDGAAVRINSKNYFFNVGYGDGSSADDIKSGRSYGVGPTSRESDPSDAFFLKELGSYLKKEPKHAGDFYRAIMQALTDCDTSGWEDLSTAGQIVATDFMAIYTAENDRHLMVDLKPRIHPWEIDLATTTFVSAFDAASGLINQADGDDFKLVKGTIDQWWAKGKQGSGIGETRDARMDLTSKISDFERKRHPDLVQSIESITGKNSDGDVIQGLFEYLNSPNGPDQLGDRADKLTDAVVAFIQQVQEDAGDFADAQ